MKETRIGFRGAYLMCVLGLVAGLILGGAQGLAVVAMLGLLEVVLSFDNAVVNAGILKRMEPFWQRMFLTVGVLVAVVGVRMLVPLGVVAATAHLSPSAALDLALNHATEYHQVLMEAQPKIAAFGGVFLLMLFLNFITEEREITWLRFIERPFARLGRVPQMPALLCVSLLLIAAAATRELAGTVLIAGGIGLLTYMGINALGSFFERHGPESDGDGDEDAPDRPAAMLTGMAAFMTFCYLEVLDASYSFDSVLGAFSVTTDVVMITVGLAIGVAFFRALTIYIVRNDLLDEYVYVEHGAYYAIGSLAVLLIVEIWHDMPDALTGLAGTVIIAAAFGSSVVHNRRHRTPEKEPVLSGHA